MSDNKRSRVFFTRHDDLIRLLAERPFDLQVLDANDLYTEAVRELLEHHDGLHDDDVLVRRALGF